MEQILLDKTRWGWWQSAVFYQIYPKSFQDTTGKGIGDLRGVISRLDYLQELGIDGIWLSPVFASPQVDNGYDISDYCAIDPIFGTMEDMEELIAEGKKRGISIILDLVLNHCSNRHPWFLEALKGRDAPYHDYFIWRDGDGVTPPNEMKAWGADVDRARLYSAPDCSELSMVFQFEHIGLDQQSGKEKWDLKKLYLPDLKACMARWQNGLHGKGWNSLFLNNHDLPRIVSRWGDEGKYRVASAKMLATMLHGLEGTPFIYQGEELGMTNVRLKLEEYVDLEIHNLYAQRTAQGYSAEEVMASIYARGRDNARTPMQWTDGPNAGFTTGTPWLPVNPNYQEINAQAQQADPDSVFHYYKRLIRLRKATPVICHGDFTLLDPEDEAVFAYLREDESTRLLVVCNFTADPVAWHGPEGFENARCLISNYPDQAPALRPYEAYMLLSEK